MSVETATPLAVVHRPGRPSPGGRPAPFPAWRIATCQRELVISLDAAASAAWVRGDLPDAELLRGDDAYRLLLEIATGLRSAIAGETNVAGQLRQAWQSFESDPTHDSLARRLAPTVQRLFADTAFVRQRWLQGLGGSSYGSLARRLLACRRGARVLIVGAGDLARSVLPAFRNRQAVALFTRTTHGAHALADSSLRRFASGEEAAALAWAEYVVFCIPSSAEFARTWLPLLCAEPGVDVLHLGARDHDAAPWRSAGASLRTLDDLFALATRLGSVRESRLEAARAACAELAYAADFSVGVPRRAALA